MPEDRGGLMGYLQRLEEASKILTSQMEKVRLALLALGHPEREEDENERGSNWEQARSKRRRGTTTPQGSPSPSNQRKKGKKGKSPYNPNQGQTAAAQSPADVGLKTPPTPTARPSTSSASMIGDSPAALEPRNSEPPQTEAPPQPHQGEKALQGKKPPPIFLKDLETLESLCSQAGEELRALFTARASGDHIRLQTNGQEDFRHLQNLLEGLNIPYFSFRPQWEEKLRKFIVRPIPLSTPLVKVEKAFEDLGFDVKARQLTKLSGETRRTLPVFEVTAKGDTAGITSIRSLLQMEVTVEPSRPSKGPVQCHRCQAYGHVQWFCKQSPRCHKCAGNHHFRDCKKSLKDPLQCINCGGEHAANYRGCPANPSQRLQESQRPAAPRGKQQAQLTRSNRRPAVPEGSAQVFTPAPAPPPLTAPWNRVVAGPPPPAPLRTMAAPTRHLSETLTVDEILRKAMPSILSAINSVLNG